jgi:acetoin utilization deacetylase AcuC-like enzyme
VHQFPHDPGTGLATDRGFGDGEGATLNCPMPPGTGDKHWRRAFEREMLPALEAFAPQLVIVSAGFDAHELDPLSETDLHEESYAAFTRELLQATSACAGGRMVSLLEGGYHLDALASSAAAHVGAMLEAP